MRERASTVVCGLLLSGAVLLTYASSFSGLFIGDDRKLLIETAGIADFHPLLEKLFLFGGHGQCTAGRPVVAASFMLNLALEGGGPRNPWGYHLVNVAVHIACALLVFGLLGRTLARLPRFAAHATPLACGAALLWALHPVHTSAVTILCQRAEALMSMFFVLALYASLRALASPRAWSWHALAVVAAMLAAGTKENAAALPLLALLHDRTFVADSFRQALARRPRFYAAFTGGCWLVVAAMISFAPRGAALGFEIGGLNALNYLLTQCNALLEYVRLMFWPYPLLIDYGWPIVPVDGPGDLLAQAGSYLPGLIVVSAAAAAGVWAIARRLPAGFWAAWFFAILAPSSSVVPIATEVMVLHRLYLPTLAVIVPVVMLAYAGAQRLLAARWLSAGSMRALGLLTLATLALGLGLVTDAHNRLFHDDLLPWADTLRHQPRNQRVLVNLGRIVLARGNLPGAVELLERAVGAARATERPRHLFLNDCLLSAAQAQRQAGNLARASAHLRDALALHPERVELRLQLASDLARTNQTDDAVALLRTGLARPPADRRLQGALIATLLVAGRVDTARAEARTLRPTDDARAIDQQLAFAARRLGRHDIAATLARSSLQSVERR